METNEPRETGLDALHRLYNPPAQPGDGAPALASGTGPRTLQTIGAEIREHAARLEYHRRGTVWEAIEIGRRLQEARDTAQHGEWADFLARETGYSRQTANNFLRVFEAYGDRQQDLLRNDSGDNVQTFGRLSYGQALALLSVPEEDREDFMADHEVENLTVRQLKEAIRQEREARMEAEEARDRATAERNNADLARAKAEHDRDEAFVERDKVETKVTNLKIDLDQAHGEMEKAENALYMARTAAQNADSRAANAEAALKTAEESRNEMARHMKALKAVHEATVAELEELRSHPVDVAVEVDEEAVEQARQEAYGAAREEAKIEMKASATFYALLKLVMDTTNQAIAIFNSTNDPEEKRDMEAGFNQLEDMLEPVLYG